jgi:hypothetical protein
MKLTLYALLWLLLMAALIVIAPLVFIWALNQLFSLSIAYNFWDWLASIIIISFLGGHKTVQVLRPAGARQRPPGGAKQPPSGQASGIA